MTKTEWAERTELLAASVIVGNWVFARSDENECWALVGLGIDNKVGVSTGTCNTPPSPPSSGFLMFPWGTLQELRENLDIPSNGKLEGIGWGLLQRVMDGKWDTSRDTPRNPNLETGEARP